MRLYFILAVMIVALVGGCRKKYQVIMVDQTEVKATTVLKGGVRTMVFDDPMPGHRLTLVVHKLRSYYYDENGYKQTDYSSYRLDSTYSDSQGNFELTVNADTLFTYYTLHVYDTLGHEKGTTYIQANARGVVNDDMRIVVSREMELRLKWIFTNFDSGTVKIMFPNSDQSMTFPVYGNSSWNIGTSRNEDSLYTFTLYYRRPGDTVSKDVTLHFSAFESPAIRDVPIDMSYFQ